MSICHTRHLIMSLFPWKFTACFTTVLQICHPSTQAWDLEDNEDILAENKCICNGVERNKIKIKP